VVRAIACQFHASQEEPYQLSHTFLGPTGPRDDFLRLPCSLLAAQSCESSRRFRTRTIAASRVVASGSKVVVVEVVVRMRSLSLSTCSLGALIPKSERRLHMRMRLRLNLTSTLTHVPTSTTHDTHRLTPRSLSLGGVVGRDCCYQRLAHMSRSYTFPSANCSLPFMS
jgi:hypothetical protein